ncbi:UDP-4-amino-4,6-dideoxy-N-acetyl-beta-L-altrosamine transaminase [Niveibacterium sp. 24ML]|uniref:UDP-4-amino-4, 6-dideoxy-N-acetyl-beta-L-altrosamine transaminase n=1 Tax=Niveibacterium sp. 24ML TaxID=2985512 RepID=UPI00226ED932|nr:UDP-4-amino-4,6-dideoxy-N-acetyl-beta-L-altrosamine transaminase [Niveibacterium sp. 24ML]MCX9156152.1 UDP-4-amino-4,6-dideoxy-N-acetyl-beta-L-altrosamine transaminase [Niveibacterium sp. 24ML]
MIPYGRQSISHEDLAAVEAVLRSDWLTQGPAVSRFEAAVADYVGARHAVAVNSATSALHIACAALGVGPGSRVWTVPNTFVASANCARYCGAEVGFVDIDARSYCIDVADLARRLQAARAVDALPDVLVSVDFAGQPCDYAAIADLKREYGFRLIEDASHAIGATLAGARIGALPVADITVFSFHPVKIVTSAEGGMLLTADADLAAAARRLRSHGIERDPARLTQPDQGGWYYEQQELGWNYRITDLQAALGASQIARIDAFLERRRALAQRYDEALADLPLQRPWQRPGALSAYHLYPIVLRDADQRRQVYERLREAGIGVQVHYLPVHLQPYYRALGFAPGQFPVAEWYAERTLSLPLYADLTEAAQDCVIAAMREALK